MPYRIELAKQGRAVCKNKECKDAAVKIEKGEFRMGTLVTIHEHTSWTWKHWGCVTPLQISHLQEDSGGDTDMVDGYDELPPEGQEKIKFALANGHVPDEDWKGDLECNRPGAKGFRVKAKAPKGKKGKKADEDADADADADAEEIKPKKKRARVAKDDDDEEAPAPKKSRGKGKKAAVKDEEEAVSSEVDLPDPKVKKAAKGRKAAKTQKKVDPESEVEVEVKETTKPKRGKKAAPAENKEKPAPQKRTRKKKAVPEEE